MTKSRFVIIVNLILILVKSLLCNNSIMILATTRSLVYHERTSLTGVQISRRWDVHSINFWCKPRSDRNSSPLAVILIKSFMVYIACFSISNTALLCCRRVLWGMVFLSKKYSLLCSSWASDISVRNSYREVCGDQEHFVYWVRCWR